MYTIYMHKNKINNKVYIGQTMQKPENRWKKGEGYKNNIYFYRAIQKYGWDNFEHLILEQSDEWTQEECNDKEKYYIQLYNAANKEYGYNINPGGYHSISPKATPALLEWMKEHPEFNQARVAVMLKWQKEHPEETLQMRRMNIKKA